MQVINDKALDIALGNSRKTKTWKNKPLQWSDLLDRLSQTTRTPESVAEYKAMSRNQQSEVKDVGGFVGGYCNNGSRSDIRFRSVLCLDADFADADIWPDWELIYGNAAAVYSTHKHTSEKPRLRLVVPLARDVSPDEYQAIGRRVAYNLGIDKFDDTSYQPQRMMYWPSTSQDGEYVFRYTDAAFLEPDEVLATYHDWQDISSWPMSSRTAEIVQRAAAKQQDPLEKTGAVGAFCRAYYPISEAIEAFITTYQPCDEPNRYTYTEGSTGAGVVIYDDKFSYSHHATDPASGQTCNAWDLVRLHKFGQLDADVDPRTSITNRPSFKAMEQLAMNDDRTKQQIFRDKEAEAADDFGEPLPEDAPQEEWRHLLKVSSKGATEQSITNVVTILNHDPKLRGCIAYDALSNTLVTRRDLPWRTSNGISPWVDADDSNLRLYLEQLYGISGKDKIYDAVSTVAQRARFNPVMDYLAACTWDGVPRVDTLLIDYLGADDTAYTRAVTRKTLVAAVARIYRPGCKFDYMLTLRGAQGLGKSSIISKLAGDWFSDSFTAVQGKESYEQLHGVWIMEVGELAGMRKSEVEAIKLYISKRSDRFRPAYGRWTQEFPRHCIFIGTTNESQFLRDATGNRRFWVVDTPNDPAKDLWKDLTPEVIRQIWGEAVELFKRGEKLYLPKDLESVAREVQEIYEEENPNVDLVASYLDRLLPEGWETMDLYSRRSWLETAAEGTTQRTTVCTLEIWEEALGQPKEKFDRYAGKEVRDIMAKLPEWRYMGNAKISTTYGRQRYYKRRTEK